MLITLIGLVVLLRETSFSDRESVGTKSDCVAELFIADLQLASGQKGSKTSAVRSEAPGRAFLRNTLYLKYVAHVYGV